MNRSRTAVERLLAILVLIAAAAVFYAAVIGPIIQKYNSVRQTLLQSQYLLARYRQRAGTLEALKERLATLKRRNATTTNLIAASNETLAAAVLQNMIKSLAQAHGGELLSTQVLPPSNDGTLRQVKVKFRLRVAIEGLSAILYRLQTGSPLTVVDSLEVRGPPRYRFVRPNQAHQLEVILDIIGFIRATRT